MKTGDKKYWLILIILAVDALSGLRADEVPPAYRMIALEKDLPPSLLYAVALTESGQSSLSEDQLRPWPWTLNVNGKGQYFPSRKAAWRALQHALASEQRSVDIGLMQINWRYHQQALGSPWQALEPYHNLRVGASILKGCHVTKLNWQKNVGCYHAPNNPPRAQRYSQRVTDYWQQLTQE